MADMMSNVAQQLNPQFHISVGDNFYFNGVDNANDERFKVALDKLV